MVLKCFFKKLFSHFKDQKAFEIKACLDIEQLSVLLFFTNKQYLMLLKNELNKQITPFCLRFSFIGHRVVQNVNLDHCNN